MRGKKYYIALNDFERRVVVNCLNEMRKTLLLIVSTPMRWTRFY